MLSGIIEWCRRGIFLFFLLGFVAQTWASDSQKIAANLQATYQQASDWNARFTQTTFVELIDKTIQKEGTIAIKKPGKIRIEYNQEDGRLYVSNGKKLVVTTPGESRPTVYKNFSKVMAKEGLSFLGGLGQLNREFTVSPVSFVGSGDLMMQDRRLSLLQLVPHDRDSLFEKIVLGIDPKTKLVNEMTLFNSSGNKTHYVFKNIRLNAGLDDGMFVFQK